MSELKPSEVAAEAVMWGLLESEAKARKDAARAWLAERMGPELLAVKAIADGRDVGKATFTDGRRELKVVDRQAFTGYVAEHYPTEVEQVAVVNTAFEKAHLAALTDVDGTVIDDAGVVVPGVELRTGAPYVSVRKSAEARETVQALMSGGRLSLDPVKELEA